MGPEKSSVLTITNPFDKQLNYKAFIKVPNRDGYKKTSIVPIYPKIYSIEMWPYKIESIILTDFKLK